jgi:diaminopimelate decarboxylase
MAGHPSLIVDAGVNLLYTATWYKFNIRPAKAVPSPPVPTKIYGCLCMNIDVLREQAPLPHLTVGDKIVFHPVGAYNVTQSMQFISYRPRIVMINRNGVAELIREREDLEYVEQLERLPKHLERSS